MVFLSVFLEKNRLCNQSLKTDLEAFEGRRSVVIVRQRVLSPVKKKKSKESKMKICCFHSIDEVFSLLVISF